MYSDLRVAQLREAMFNVKMVLEKTRKIHRSKDVYILCFADYGKTFDRVDTQI